MQTEKRYNGWTNYETWAVKLWMDNEQGSQEFWSEQAREAYDNATADKTFSREENAAFALRDSLKDQHEEQLPELQGFAADLLNAAMSEVNWHEIAETLVSDAANEEA